MQGISRVLQRMNAIEQKFNAPSGTVADFAKVLSTTQQKKSATGKTEKSIALNDIGKMVELTANKYGVDPKLALAVANVESNLIPDAVSSAGAVGVMQLMPETAEGLGVSNSKDPQDNIDGGVRYLKQLINTFNGDTTKAIAAYNAGAQAVKDYNGIPPYKETQDYVSKVMAQYK